MPCSWIYMKAFAPRWWKDEILISLICFLSPSSSLGLILSFVKLPWKSLTSIIEYYYMWKTTDRYVQQVRLIPHFTCRWTFKVVGQFWFEKMIAYCIQLDKHLLKPDSCMLLQSVPHQWGSYPQTLVWQQTAKPVSAKGSFMWLNHVEI